MSPIASPGAGRSAAAVRLPGIDAMRYLAFCAVVVLHTPKFGAGARIDELMRFAVPFYFISAGYFLARAPAELGAAMSQKAQRLLVPYALWFVVYAVVYGVNPDSRTPLGVLQWFVTGGAGFHLWFLPALLLCDCVMLALRRRLVAAAVLAAALYLVGLCLGPYFGALGGSSPLIWDIRNGPFFGFIFVVAGFAMSKASVRPNLMLSLLVVGSGLAISELEIGLLKSLHQLQHSGSEFLLGTLPLGVGAFWLAMSLPDRVMVRAVARLGGYSMGCYCIHLLVLRFLIGAIAPHNNLTSFAEALGAIVGATLLVVALGQARVLRPLLR